MDCVIASHNLIKSLHNFDVYQTDWLPSDHAPISLELSIPKPSLECLLDRASSLGGHVTFTGQQCHVRKVNRPVKLDNIATREFSNCILNFPAPSANNNIDTFASKISDTLYKCAASCDSNVVTGGGESGEGGSDVSTGNIDRWERLLRDPDDARVWRAIDWKGTFQDKPNQSVCPSDQDFKDFYSELKTNNDPDIDVTTNVYIPMLDDPITPDEVAAQIKKMKPHKACGPDGVPPSVSRLLPIQWILTITTLFNAIFCTGAYPVSWSTTKLFMIFKKGSRLLPNNYRGISIMNTISKLYDMVLCERLERWYVPPREQAGAQKGRGCLEHIVTLRILTDFARKKKKTLYVTFIDFIQAYDLVPRKMLFAILKRLGCGAVMLAALVAIYSKTDSVLGTVLIASMMGVRQGSPTSCILFIIFVNDLIKLIKETCEPDGFLSWMHLLVMMDDTVLLSTTRLGMLRKLKLLLDFCNRYGMRVNLTKTKFFVVSGTERDKESLIVDGLIVDHCDQYVYLGSPFTADGSVHSAVRAHAIMKMPHFNKFISFVTKNNDVHFVVKKRVFDAAFMSSFLYACESWLNADLKPVVKMYNWALKQILGVRKTTCSDVCYIESGCPPIEALVKDKQYKYFRKVYRERSGMTDDPLTFALLLLMNTQYNTKNYVRDLLNIDQSPIYDAMERIRRELLHSDSSRRITYRELMNTDLSTHDIYTTRHTVNELHRTAFTRFRGSAHSLAVETGRWNRRGRPRLPVDERICQCGAVQTEEHVVMHCPLSEHVRSLYNITSVHDIFSGRFPSEVLCKIIFDILNLYC